MQRDWVGRSVGARIVFELPSLPGETLEVFTTRPDTLFGATYLVLAPEHPLTARLATPEQRAEVLAYVESAARRSERARQAEAEGKTGVATGAFARHPVTGRELPIWIADYVLAGYGTGAIMAVPAHDERDFEFARALRPPDRRGGGGRRRARGRLHRRRRRRELGLPRRPCRPRPPSSAWRSGSRSTARARRR